MVIDVPSNHATSDASALSSFTVIAVGQHVAVTCEYTHNIIQVKHLKRLNIGR